MKKLFASIIEKVFGIRIVRVPSEAKKQELRDRNYREFRVNKVAQSYTPTEVASNKRDITPEDKNKAVEDIMASIFALGYQAIPSILEEYPEQIIKHWVIMQKVALGDYAAEVDILDDMEDAELIKVSCELNQMQFEKRMIDQGKAHMSAAQKSLVERLIAQAQAKFPQEVYKMPTNKFEASSMIERLNKVLNNKPKDRIIVDNMTEGQRGKLRYLCATLDVEVPKVESIKEASDRIQELQTQLDAHPELIVVKYATEPQLQYMKRLYALEGKKWTKQSAAKWMKLTQTEMSAELQNKKAELEAKCPELLLASASQVSYIKDLLNRLSVPYNPEDLPKLTKEQATQKIDGLRRDLLFIYSRTSSPISKEDIKAMTSDAVKDMLKHITMENKTTWYTEDHEVVDNKTATER